jgi:sterol desaturase/sphingolipid hydroxylase (fatty acid hydroxylase superfamily)
MQEVSWLVFFVVILGRYFLIAGGAHLVFYLAPGNAFCKRELRLKPPTRESITRDIELSIISALISSFVGAVILWGYERGATLLYTSFQEYGAWYLGVSFILVLILQDAYFYFMHRMFHHPALFKWLHRGHHRSGDPTPWTSFAFDPAEALVHSLFVLGVVFVVPLHFITLVAVLMTMTLWAVWTHLGFESFPPSFSRHWFGRWLIGPTHHSLHHRKYKSHYGLYFTFWDRLLGTQDPSYEDDFDSSLRT